MASIEPIGTLKQRKQALLIESDLNRLMLRLEVEQLRSSTTRLDAALDKARRVGPWLLPLFSALGIFAGRKARNATSKRSWLSRGLRLLPLLLQLRRHRDSAGESPQG
jgi:hypothetical protein